MNRYIVEWLDHYRLRQKTEFPGKNKQSVENKINFYLRSMRLDHPGFYKVKRVILIGSVK